MPALLADDEAAAEHVVAALAHYVLLGAAGKDPGELATKDEQAEALEAELQNAGLPAKIVGTLLEKDSSVSEIVVE